MVSMDRNKWIWVSVVCFLLNILIVAIELLTHFVFDLKMDMLFVNIIRAPLVLFVLIALVMAFLAKK